MQTMLYGNAVLGLMVMAIAYALIAKATQHSDVRLLNVAGSLMALGTLSVLLVPAWVISS